MVRTQIQLTNQQARRLRAEARDRGLSLAEVIRQYVDLGLSAEAPNRDALYDRAAALVGRFHDLHDAADIARHHDRYLDDAFE
jgi:hypothetical protein